MFCKYEFIDRKRLHNANANRRDFSPPALSFLYSWLKALQFLISKRTYFGRRLKSDHHSNDRNNGVKINIFVCKSIDQYQFKFISKRAYSKLDCYYIRTLLLLLEFGLFVSCPNDATVPSGVSMGMLC